MTVEDMEDLLERLDIEVVSVRGSEVQARCPAHKDRTGKEDSNPSWYINAETGAHICFSCHFKGGVQYLVGYVNGYYDADGNVDFDKSKDWLSSQESLASLLERATRVHAPEPEPVVFDAAMLHAFVEPPDFALQSRGLTREAAQSHGILWNERGQSWIIPVKNSYTGEYIGWQEKAYQGRFFKNYPPGMKKSSSVFGYDRYTSGDLIVVESPLDAVRLSSVGIESGVAIYGSFISSQQVNLIKSADRIIFALDNDQAGIDSSNKLISYMRDLWFEAWFFNYDHTDQKDIGGMSRSEIEYGVANAEHFLKHLPLGA